VPRFHDRAWRVAVARNGDVGVARNGDVAVIAQAQFGLQTLS
jgi:hypothetical protein